MRRLEQPHQLQLLNEPTRRMKLIQHDRARFRVEVKRRGAVARPPIATLPEYLAHRSRFQGDHPL